MTTVDPYQNFLRGWDAPMEAGELADIGTADHEFSRTTRGVLVLGAGAVVVRLRGNSADLTFTVAGDIFLPLQVTHVRMSGTTATVVGFW